MPNIPVETIRKVLDAIALLAPYAEEAPDPAPVPPLTNQSRVGGNITSQWSTTRWHLYADAAKSGYPVTKRTRPDGTVYWEQIVFKDQVAAQGTYLLEAGTVEVAPGQSSLTINYSSDPGPAPRVIRPGCTPDQMFTPAALAQLAPLGRIRFMDLTGTNGSTQTTWESRPKLTDSTWGKAAPWEVCIALCNQTGKDAWFCIPHGATLDYIEGFKALVESTLRPELNCYVEYGNELWNNAGVFAVARKFLLNQTKQLIAAGNLSLTQPDENAQNPNGLRPDGTARNETYALWRNIARNVADLKALLGPRFRVILAGQNAEPLICKIGLEYIAANYGPPKDYLYAIATAPYMGMSKADQARTDLTPDQVVNILLASTDPAPDKRVAHRALADQYGVRYVAYECGTHVDISASPKAVYDAQSLPKMGEVIEKYLTTLLADGPAKMDEINYFSVGANWGYELPNKVSQFGASPGTHMTGPKWDALAKVAKQ